MHLLNTLTFGLAGLSSVLAGPHNRVKLNDRASIESFMESESSVALRGLLCNIGNQGCEASGVPNGVVIASPSKSNPDYWYTWTRDAALVMKAIVERFSANSTFDTGLQNIIHAYVGSQAKLQGVSNPSGSLSDGSGLAEPKYNVDLTAFTGGWGRPQRDGPALRAIALMQYAKWMVDNGYPETASEVLWPIIRNDLAYVGQYWNQTGFDLWEEVSGSSFFTTAAQYRALVQGSKLAAELGTTCSTCGTVAPKILCFLQSYWSSSGNYLIANINQNNGRAGRDANTILGSIHNFDPSLGCDALTFQPCSDKGLANHKAVVDSFRSWNINSGIPKGTAVSVGRYIEDVYYNGNPWYLSTLAAAEQLYDALRVWESQGSIQVTSISLNFFRDFNSSISTGTYTSGSATYTNLMAAILDYADGFVDIVQTYMGTNGALAEQFDKSTGGPLSARDLTWSYAAFLTAAAARAKVHSSQFSWANGVAVLPASCQATSVSGAYITATNTHLPTLTPSAGNETITVTAAEPSSTSCAIGIYFHVLVTTNWGDTIKVVGSVDALGNWDTSKAIALTAWSYTASNPLWDGTLSMSPGQSFQYKFIKVTSSGVLTWEADPNRSFIVPSSCGGSGTTGGSWQS